MLLTIRAFLALQVALFTGAGLVHHGILVQGYRHQQAGIAETVIAGVLLAGLTLTWVRPAWARGAGIAAQAFALVGTLVGAFTIAVGVGPRTPLDIGVHAAMLALLIAGLASALRRAKGLKGRRTAAAPARSPRAQVRAPYNRS